MDKPILTTPRLIGEFITWGKDNRRDGLRFGQYIHSQYDLVPDVAFYTEDLIEAYVELLEGLYNYQR